jgi:hypothetical protein
MSISKIKTGSITTDAITEAKVADNAIENEHINSNVITGQTELSAAAADDDVLLVYDTSAGAIKKIQSSNVGLQAPTISSISPTNLISGDGTGNYTITITGTGYIADVTAKLVKQGGSDLAFDTVTRNSSTQLTCVIAKSSILNADEPFDVVVTTAGALTATDTDAITVDASPAFVTASGSLGTFDEGDSINVSVNATDPDSAGNVTFELQSGTLPAGLSLTNTAAEGGTAIISGTASAVAANTTSNFTLRAVDAASNTTSRSFSITVNNVLVSQSFTSSGTFSVPSGTTVVDVLVVAGGGGSGANHAGGGGAGGLIFMPEYPVTPDGTLTVTVGCGGAGGPGANDLIDGCNGQDSTFGSPGDPGLGQGGVLTAKGGGGGGTGQTGNASPGVPGGSGGGGGGLCTETGGLATQPTQPGNSGAYGFGNAGGPSDRPGPLNVRGGGGGGAGVAGQSGAQGSQGGDGKAYTIADGTTPVYYAGGGGGGKYDPSGYVQTCGGLGGGGVSNSPSGPATAGGANTGGGGGAPQQAGGKGIVIVRY